VAVAVAGTALAGAAGAGVAQGATVTVHHGETLGAIASRAGVSVTALARENGITNPNRVRAGRALRLPETPGRATAAQAPSGSVHRVRRGETLSAIAAQYGVGVRTLMTLNGLTNPHRIAAGRVLRLPAATVAQPTPLPAAAAPAPVPTPGPPAGADWSRDHVAALIADAAPRYGLDPALVRAVAWQESGWDQRVVSNVGAVGVMQLMPGTAAWLGPSLLGRAIDPSLIEDNVEGGVAYLAWLLRSTGDTSTAVAAYYQGLTSVRKRGVIRETRRYVANVLALVGRV
jgi:soluble lytic murein transglycosylase-like protein